MPKENDSLKRHATLRDQLAAATELLEMLAATVKRQPDQITRLHADVKALKSADH